MQQALSFRSSFFRAVRLLTATSLAATAIVIALPAGPAEAAYTPPSSISTDCSRDVAAELTNWIASVPNGSTLSFAAGGCYRIDGTVFVRSRSSLVFEGNGATFRAFVEGANGRHHWYLDQGSNLVLRNMTITGSDPTPGTFESSLYAQHGVFLNSVQGARLEGLKIQNVHGDFVYVGPHRYTPSRDVLVRDGAFKGAGRQGVAVVNGERITIDGNRVELIGNSVFDLEGNATVGDVIRDIAITNNTVGAHRHMLLPNDHAPGGVNVLVANNRVLGEGSWPTGPGSGWATVHANAGGANWVIRNNDFARLEGAAFNVQQISGVTVSCNRVTWLQGTGAGVSSSSSNVRITDNRFVRGSALYTGTGVVENAGNGLTDTAFPSSCGTIGPIAAGTTTPAPTATATPTSTPTPTAPPAPVDETPPSTPPGLKAGWVKRALHLEWQAASDNVGVTGYHIYRNGTLVGSTTSLRFLERTSWKKSYTYSVRAYDARGNLSDPANVSVSPLAVEERSAKRARPSR